MVRVLAFYSDNSSSNPAKVYNSAKMDAEKNQNKQNGAGIDHLKKFAEVKRSIFATRS